ncbi:MAG TPA: mechanosensitive ion channel family protein [Firmicutes bacterium]|nr:mechanosensitive ion channel family protein [Bacillota bacterium]
MEYAFSWWRTMWEQSAVYAARLPAALIIILFTYILVRILKKVSIATLKLTKADPTLRSLVLSTISFAAWVLGTAGALNALGLTQISLALGGSIALVAMALATGLNSIAQDLLAGIFLFSDDDFCIGKRVKAAGIEGEVAALTIRKTKIMDDQGNVHTIPNRTIDGATYTIYHVAKDEEIKKAAGEGD